MFNWFRGKGQPAAPFRMPVDDAFALKVPGKVVVVGVVAEGEVRPGARLVLRAAAAELPVTVEALEAYASGSCSSARKRGRSGRGRSWPPPRHQTPSPFMTPLLE